MKRLWVVAALATLAALPCRAAAQTEISCPAGVPEPQLRVLEGEPFSIDGDVLTVRAVVEAPCALTDATTATATAPWGAEGTDDVPALRSRGRAPVEIELAIPAGESGERQITVSVPRGFDDDPDFQIEESNAALGDNAREITVTLPGAKTPDLAVRPADEPSGTPDGRIELFAVVANEGDAAARPTTATVRTPWGAEQEVDVPALATGGEAPVDAGFDVPADRQGTTADFEVAVDAVRREVDLEDNATTIRDVALPGGGSSAVPDLAVGRLRLAPQTDPASAEVLAVLRNEGNTATAAGRARLSAGWGDAVRQDVPALEPGETAALRFRLPVPPAERGRRRGLAVAVRPVAGETDTADNRDVIVPRLIAAAPDGPDGGFPVWPAVAALALALAAAALLARRLWRGGKTPPLTAPPLREIETGFEAGNGPLPDGEPLVPGADYQFWLRVGPPVTSGAGRRQRAEVALTTLAGGLAAAPLRERAAVELDAYEPARVRVPLRWLGDAGTPVLRASLCVEGAIVWSKRIPVPVRGGTAPPPPEVDFAIAPQLDPERLADMSEHKLAVLLNQDRQGTHTFTFIGDRGRHDAVATFDGLELQRHVDALRGALRRAAWGDPREWRRELAYRYREPDPARAHADMIRMAIEGWRAYSAIAQRLAGTPDEDFRLAERMQRPGLVQIAVKESARLHFPAALLYDHALDTTVPEAEVDAVYRICPDFAAACEPGAVLQETACFRGECAHAALETVCPSGFWGFRHALGAPLSARENEDVPGTIAVDEPAAFVLAVGTDDDLELREDHEVAITRLAEPLVCHRAATRADALRQLAEEPVRIAYFYCHGGLAGAIPYLRVGPVGERPITPDLLLAYRLRWSGPGRPLVFLNGCRTTAVEPRQALEFVGAWLRTAQAGGVVGTDITVFEPLATRFAVACLGRFLSGMPLGEAVRLARLELLAEHNPLALAYVAFALPSLRVSRLGV